LATKHMCLKTNGFCVGSILNCAYDLSVHSHSEWYSQPYNNFLIFAKAIHVKLKHTSGKDESSLGGPLKNVQVSLVHSVKSIPNSNYDEFLDRLPPDRTFVRKRDAHSHL
jgi:hypothetical protein